MRLITERARWRCGKVTRYVAPMCACELHSGLGMLMRVRYFGNLPETLPVGNRATSSVAESRGGCWIRCSGRCGWRAVVEELSPRWAGAVRRQGSRTGGSADCPPGRARVDGRWAEARLVGRKRRSGVSLEVRPGRGGERHRAFLSCHYHLAHHPRRMRAGSRPPGGSPWRRPGWTPVRRAGTPAAGEG